MKTAVAFHHIDDPPCVSVKKAPMGINDGLVTHYIRFLIAASFQLLQRYVDCHIGPFPILLICIPQSSRPSCVDYCLFVSVHVVPVVKFLTYIKLMNNYLPEQHAFHPGAVGLEFTPLLKWIATVTATQITIMDKVGDPQLLLLLLLILSAKLTPFSISK